MEPLFMKLLIYIIAIMFSAKSTQLNKSYTLNGSFNGETSEEWIYMVKFMGNYAFRDSAKIENGKFQFKGVIDVPEMYAFHYRIDRIIGVASRFIEPGNLYLNIDLKNWELNSRISGGKINDEYNSLEYKRIERFMKPIWSLDTRSQTANKEELKTINDSIKFLLAENEKFEMEYVKNHLNSPIALYLLFRNQFSLSLDEKETLLSKFNPILHNATIYKVMVADYNNQVKIKNQTDNLNKINDIQLFQTTTSGDSLLSKLIAHNPNKVLYIDIWATWCGPCKKEFPYSRKLYDMIDPERIQMIYLCVGSSKDEWEKVVKSEVLNGQHYLIDDENLKKFGNKNSINIQGIPRYIIVGSDGTIKNKNAPKPSSANLLDILVKY